MGYREGKVSYSRTERTGASCDDCGREIEMGHFGAMSGLELRVDGGLRILYTASGSPTPILLYCRECASKLLDVIPGLKKALNMEESDG